MSKDNIPSPDDEQDRLFSKYPDDLQSVYDRLKYLLGKEPTPASVVNKFKRDYPDKE